MSELIPKNTDEYGRDEKGRFAEGNNGRPKGTPNKTTRDVKEFITNFLNDKAFEIPHIWDALEDKDKATLYLHLCKLVLPKVTTGDPSTSDRAMIEQTTYTPEQARQRLKELEEEY